jgi:hypothetical protein
MRGISDGCFIPTASFAVSLQLLPRCELSCDTTHSLWVIPADLLCMMRKIHRVARTPTEAAPPPPRTECGCWRNSGRS